MIKLGQEVKDRVTGFTGIAISRAEWLFGCIRIGIKPQGLDSNGRTQETEFFDEGGGGGHFRGYPGPDSRKGPGGPDREHPHKEHYIPEY